MGKGITVLDKTEPVVMGSTFADRSVLVTGASGFIGSALVNELVGLGARVYVLSQTVDFQRPLYGQHGPVPQPLAFDIEKVIHGDLRHRTDCFHAVSIAEPEFVFHLGAMTQVTEASRTPIEAFRVNALGTMHMLDACRQIMGTRGSNIIVASSDKAYGEPWEPDMPPFHEYDMLNPIHPYDLSKAVADITARSFGEYYGLKVQVTRLANVYGPGDTNWKRLIPGMFRWILEGNQPIIRSDGTQVRQYLFIKDAVVAYLLLAQAMAQDYKLDNAQAWNFAPPSSARHSVLEVVSEITSIMQNLDYEVQEPRVLGEAKDETDELYLDSSKGERELGWKVNYGLAGGLAETMHFIRLYLKLEEQ